VPCKRRTDAMSLACLPALIYEIDSRQRRPTKAKRAEMVERYRGFERSLREPRNHEQETERACHMVNGHLIDVIWRLRPYRERAERWKRERGIE